jgi:eukaryotic-like serine/threonine-protein kinase
VAIIVFRGREGELLGERFRVVNEIGSGSFGEVWLAQRVSDGGMVALKIPKDQEKGEEVLRRESEIIKGINHPNIVRILGYHNISELFMIEMEYVDGYDLGAILDGVDLQSPLTFHQMLRWMVQILDGLAMIHNASVSHNDLKPQNILIETQTGAAKITDFGSSRRLEDVWVWTKRHGTEAYMAPEVALDGKRGRNVSDIYSLGVLLYEMATGRLPYSSPHQLLIGASISRPREINRDIPTDIEALILRAMDRLPERRYQDCASMRRDVEACLASIESAEAVDKVPARVSPSELGFRPPSSSPLYYLELAKRRLQEGDAQGALEAAESAVDRSDRHPQYVRMLGGICLRLGYYQRAAEAYEGLLSTYDRGYPVDADQRREVLERLGQIYVQRQQYGKAVQVFEELSRICDRPHVRFRLAIACGLDGDYPRSIALLELVRAERPDAVVVYSKLGWAHALNGDDRLALSYYNQALALDGENLFSLFQLGQYYFMVGDRRRSADYFKRVVHSDRDGSYVHLVKSLVGEVEQFI